MLRGQLGLAAKRLELNKVGHDANGYYLVPSSA